MLSENDSGYWKTRTLGPARREVVRVTTLCPELPLLSSNAHYLALNLTFLVLFSLFFEINYSALKGEKSSFHLFHVRRSRQCTFVREKRERTSSSTNGSKFRLLTGKGIILLIKSALIHLIGPLCSHPPTMF